MATYIQSVSGKLVAFTGAAITVIVLAFTAYSGWRTTARVNEQVIEHSTQQASWAASQIGIRMAEATSAAKTLAAMVGGEIGSGHATTENLAGMIEQVPLEYPSLNSSWIAGVPNGPLNELVSGDFAKNDVGVFTPYFTKNAEGGLDLSTFAIDEKGEWFSGPLTTGDGVTTAPYTDVSGTLMTSLATPVRVKGEIVAIAGVDITMDSMVTMIEEFETFDGGRMMLVDSGANWVAAPDRELLGKAYEDIGLDDLTAAIRDGEPRIVRGLSDGSIRLIYPFTAPGMNRTWATLLDVPAAVFSTPVRHEVIASSVGGLVILLMALGTILVASSRMVREPLGQMLEAINALADKNYEISLPSTARRDEIGAMAASVDTLRQSLIQKDTLEAEQVLLRDQAEADRLRRAADEARGREEHEARMKEAQERETRARIERDQIRKADEAEKALRAAELASVIDNLAGGLRGLAVGDLDVSIEASFPSAYDQLRIDFNNTVSHLTQLVGSISEATRRIASGTDEINAATSDLSRQTEHSAATLEETAAALNELTVSVQSAAQSSRRADGLVRETSQQAQSTTAVVNEAVTAMREIEASSSRISKIIDVIDDIAFQTNLLALNAGVEAARAGEAGRGFAVVASEVRELAQRSSAAAREIDDLISQSGTQVLNGVTLVGRTGKALQSMIEAINVISSHVGDIAASAGEQATGISEINSAVGQLDRAQQQSAATFEETSAACLALDQQANDLSQLVGQFRMRTPGFNDVAGQNAAA